MRHATFLLAAAITSLAALTGLASAPIFWQVSTRAEFLRGEVDNLSIDSDGRLSLGPVTALVADPAVPVIWDLVAGPEQVLYAASGNDGKVFRIGPDGKATVLFDSPEMEVHALAAAPGGGLFVATSPNGQIYRVASSGVAQPFYDPPDKYIWSLVVDREGQLLAATGERGAIYRIDANGHGRVLYQPKAGNVVSLAIDSAGRVLAGTENPGRIYRLDTAGRATVILDSDLREIRSIRVSDSGEIFAAAVAGTKMGEERSAETAATPPRQAPTATVTTEVTAVAVVDGVQATGAETKPGGVQGAATGQTGTIYRIHPDGIWDTLWDSADEMPYDISVNTDGSLMIATGPKGRVFRVAGEPPRATLLGRVPAQQVTRLIASGKGRFFLATANPGTVIRVGPGQASQGTYESEVRDAKTIAIWGTISWRALVPAGSRVEVFTRSGNSQTPDETWSSWEGPYRDSAGEQVVSPKARFLQWKAVLTGAEQPPTLTSVMVAYLQRNLRPVVTSITVHPPGTVFQKPYAGGEQELAGYDNPAADTRPTSVSSAGQPAGLSAQPLALGRRVYQKGLQTLQWKAEDGNEDQLEYEVRYRREDEAEWRTLRRGLSDSIYVWDTTTVPNGRYVIRVVASDEAANPPGAGLTGDLDSAAFDVDNAPPQIRFAASRREAGSVVLSFVVQDDDSPIQRVDYSIDSDRWRPVQPTDGICDSRREAFTLKLDGTVALSRVVVRAVDAMNNVATARADRPGDGRAAAGQQVR